MVWLLSLFSLASIVLVRATPIAVKRQLEAITTLSSSQINAFAPFTNFAFAAYCNPSITRTWTCGANCQANSDFQTVEAGGDGDDIQFWYVGFSPSLNTVIVAHQGTDPIKFYADLIDLDFHLEPLNSSHFPGIPPDVKAHSGFAHDQARTAPYILSAVQNILSAEGISSVTVVGHSLGGALALLDGVFLSLQLSKDVTVKVISYGMPRVGNKAFANFVDTQLSGLVTHVNNKEDPVPTVPGMFLKFHHPSGEIHIQDSGAWDACPGQDNPSNLCIVGDVNYIWKGKLKDHDGPYARVAMGC